MRGGDRGGTLAASKETWQDARAMARVQVSLRIPGTAPMPELIRLIQGVEAAGFDGAGILDSQLLCRDTFVTMALASAHTSGLTLFPAVTNPLTRHASVDRKSTRLNSSHF